MINYYTNRTFTDENDEVDIVYKNNELLFSKKSKFQDIKIFKNDLFGKILVIDNDLQLTDLDEHNYHEMIAHVPLNYLPDAENVLIIGGGDGGTAREVLKHKNIKKVDQIDIDIEVVNACIEFFPELSVSYEDSRMNLIIDDGSKWVDSNLEKKKNYYDLIIVDSTDYNTAVELFTDEFYEKLSVLLKKYGIMTFNNMSIPWDIISFKGTKHNLDKIYKYAHPFQVFQPSYCSGHYSFMFCSNKIDPVNYAVNWQNWTKKDINCRYYNKEIHSSSFNLPNFAINKIKKRERLGSHFLIDGKGCKFNTLNNKRTLICMCNFICDMYKLKVIDRKSHNFSPQGISIIFLLAESHISLHTWPELGKFSLDLFSCTDFQFNIKVRKTNINILKVIKSYLEPKEVNFNSIEREI